MLSLKRCLFIALLLITGVASAQTPVTLKQLLNSVDSKAPQLLTDSAAILIRKAQAAEVRNNWLPNLELNYQADVGTSNNTTGPYFGFGIIPSSSGGIHNTNVTTAISDNLGIAALNWEVYNFGKYGAENKVANSDITVQQNEYAQSKYDLKAFTISNYLQLLRLQDFLSIQSRNIQRTQEILRSITGRR
jgi:adhesin transport system outer membrane protein